jgi:hypothetical protein
MVFAIPLLAAESRPGSGKVKIPQVGKGRSAVTPNSYVRNKGQANNLVRSLFQSVKPQKQNYLSLLKNSSDYSSKELRWRPSFRYESSTHPELIKFKEKYNLATIAGNGTEFSQIVRLMKWAHRIIPYDGTRSVPQKRNAMSLIASAQKNNIGYDCRGMATILNETYLAMGFPSRLVTCLPRDTSDNEHHVITVVFCKSMKKWLWMDPANAAYLTDEKGNALDVREVRERLIAERPIYLNDDANINGKPVTIKQYLYDYMAKNLYWFQTPLYNGFDTETSNPYRKIDYVALFPPNYTPYGLNDIRLTEGTAYITTNADYFWQTPLTANVPASAKEKRSTSKNSRFGK